MQGDLIFLNIHVVERPRLSKFKFKGVKKGKQETLRDEINLTRGKVITPNLISNTKRVIKNYYIDKISTIGLDVDKLSRLISLLCYCNARIVFSHLYCSKKTDCVFPLF